MLSTAPLTAGRVLLSGVGAPSTIFVSGASPTEPSAARWPADDALLLHPASLTMFLFLFSSCEAGGAYSLLLPIGVPTAEFSSLARFIVDLGGPAFIMLRRTRFMASMWRSSTFPSVTSMTCWTRPLRPGPMAAPHPTEGHSSDMAPLCGGRPAVSPPRRRRAWSQSSALMAL